MGQDLMRPGATSCSCPSTTSQRNNELYRLAVLENLLKGCMGALHSGSMDKVEEKESPLQESTDELKKR